MGNSNSGAIEAEWKVLASKLKKYNKDFRNDKPELSLSEVKEIIDRVNKLDEEYEEKSFKPTRFLIKDKIVYVEFGTDF